MKNKGTTFRKSDKRVVAIIGPNACGKSSLALSLAEAIRNDDDCKGVCIVDRDLWTPVSSQIFQASGRAVDRKSPFYSTFVRPYEMLATIASASYQLGYCDTVLLPMPFSDEAEHMFNGQSTPILDHMLTQIHQRSARLIIVWVDITKTEAERRLMKRFETDPAAAARTPNALETVQADLAKKSWAFDVSPEKFRNMEQFVDQMIVFDGMHSAASFEDLKRALGVQSELLFDSEITLRDEYASPDPDLYQKLFGSEG